MKIKVIITLLFFSTAILGGLFLMKNPHITSERTINKHYKHESNCITSYADEPESGCLSESLGLYLVYLLELDDKKEFAEQVSVLKKQFIYKDKKETFIRWKLEDDITVNAIIDDVRIIQALKEGSEQFNNKTYNALADELTASLDLLTRQGIYVDFYDWKLEERASQITLSYITKQFARTIPDSIKTVEILKNVDTRDTFFSENYIVEPGKYTKQKEVHMVDQLLIATNRLYFGYKSENFDQWLKENWQDGALYGRYDRKSLKPTVDYESLAVYYYLHRYFTALNELEFADQVADRANELAEPDDYQGVHFFDYIQNQKMKQAIDSKD